MKPTREQIKSATPDELNVWVAEMMGWRWLCHLDPVHGRRYLIEPESVTNFFESEPRWINAGPEVPIARDPYERVPGSSTDPAAAWGLLEWILKREDVCVDCGSFFVCGEDDGSTGYGDDGKHVFKSSLCRAVLYWWIEQPETDNA